MNGYDFDKTIYKGDSFTAFYLYTLFKRPFLFLIFPFQALFVLLHLIGLVSKKQVKQFLMMNLKFFKNKEKLLNSFWDKKMKNIKSWYLEQKQADDIIISASPYFLVAHACKRLGLKHIIGTDMNLENGRISGKNCWGKEKVVQFEKQFGNELILKTFYSDSLSDMPMMEKSKQGIFVRGDKRDIIYERAIKQN